MLDKAELNFKLCISCPDQNTPMILLLTLAVALGLVLAALRKRWMRSMAAEREKAPDLQQLDVFGEGRRAKYKVTNLQRDLDEYPGD